MYVNVLYFSVRLNNFCYILYNGIYFFFFVDEVSVEM